MVISHTQNLIFLRVPKNASTSIAHHFIKGCDRSVDRWTQLADAGIRNNRIPQHLLHKYAYQYHSYHMTLQEILDSDLITESQAREMKKIVVIRDPLHRQLSLYFFLHHNKPKSPEHFREIFSTGKHKSDINNAITQTTYAKLHGEIAPNVDFWKFDDVNKKLSNLDTFKSEHRPKTSMPDLVESYYDEPTRQAVLDYYREDLDLYLTL